MESTIQKLSLLKHSQCDCDIDLAQVRRAVNRNNEAELKSAVDKRYARYRRKVGPNRFQCLSCEQQLKFDVGDTTRPRHRPVEHRTLDVDPLEGVSPELRELAKTAARSNDFRYTVGLHNYRTMEDWLRSVSRYDLDLKELAECQKRLLSGEKCTREQINKILRRGIWRDWNTERLEETLSELLNTAAHATAQAEDLPMSYQAAADYLAPYLKRGTCGKRYIGKLSEPGGPLKRVGRGRICPASVREYVASLVPPSSA